MQRVGDRNKLLLTLAAIAASILLFACGGGSERRASDRPAAPGPVPARASLASPEPVAAPAPPTSEPLPIRISPGAEPEEIPGPPAEGTSSPAPEEAGNEPALPPAPIVDSTGSRVFTNKDLRRFQKVKQEFGFTGDVVTVDLTKKKTAEPEDSQQEGAQPTDEQRDEEMRTTREKIAGLTAEAEYLRGRIPSLHNPLLPRATLSEADKVGESGMDNAQRLARVTGRLAQVDAELNALQRRFAELSQMKPAGPATP